MDSIPINELVASPDPAVPESADDARLTRSMARNARSFGSTPDEVLSIRLIASLRRTSNLMQRLIDAHGRPLNLSLGRANVLLALHGSPEGRLPLHLVAATLDVTRGNVSNLVQSLMDDGFVSSEADPADGRSLIVKLTAAGSIALREYIPTHYGLVAKLCSGLDAAAKAQLVALLDALRTSARDGS